MPFPSELQKEAGQALINGSPGYPRILALKLERVIEDHFKGLSVSFGSDSVKVDADIKSWTESDEWDLVLDKQELVVNFRFDFKSVISYT